ncbi:integrase core domain-containing protein [Saccharothrix yanglingensis]|uniref:integrase core domain-containing protein n=1 Tax=Saccharothrix yanglingensis TaxID=659496 RepID=UPI0027D2EFCC|nr:integrase core domain-containing protein [Saccharothrix yanglingensis]
MSACDHEHGARAAGLLTCDFFHVDCAVTLKRVHVSSWWRSPHATCTSSTPPRTRTVLGQRNKPAPRTVRREVADHLPIPDEHHLRAVLQRYANRYNHRRPHQALQLAPPRPDRSITEPTGPTRDWWRIACRRAFAVPAALERLDAEASNLIAGRRTRPNTVRPVTCGRWPTRCGRTSGFTGMVRTGSRRLLPG